MGGDASFLRALVDHSNDVLFVMDAAGVLRFASRSASWVLGLDPDDYLGTSALALVHPDDADEARAALGRSNAAGYGVLPNKVVRVRRGDGSWCWFEIASFNLVDDPAVGGFVVSGRDVTDRYEQDRVLRASEERYRLLFETSQDPVFLTDTESLTILDANPAAERTYGWSRDELVAMTATEVSAEPEATERAIREAGRERGVVQRLHRRRDGSVFPVEISYGTFALDRHQVAVAVIRDISERDAAHAVLKASEERFRLLVQHASDVITTFDADGVCTYASASIAEVFGYEPAERVGTQARDLMHPDDVDHVQTMVGQQFAGDARQAAIAYRLRHRDGSWRQVETVITNLLEEPGIRALVCNTRDVTELNTTRARLEHQATHDPLTGLPNRRLFFELAQQALARATRDPATSTGVLFVDLDEFKVINDTLGHEAGDAVLQALAERLRHTARAGDTVARLGGDEFCVVCERVASTQELYRLARRVIDAISTPPIAAAQGLPVDASVGAVLAPSGADNLDELLRRADIELYRAKRAGGGRIKITASIAAERREFHNG